MSARSDHDFRLAYEHGRLREIYTQQGKDDLAEDHFRRANAIVSRWSFKRYAKRLQAPPTRKPRARHR